MQIVVDSHSWLLAAAGGVLIGSASALLLWWNGRIAGISGIFALLFLGQRSGADRLWRALFLLGLIVGATLCGRLLATAPLDYRAADYPLLAASGLLVGIGTRMANGCTSGHGVCGLARFSRRSLLATLCFMSAAMLTVFAIRSLSA